MVEISTLTGLAASAVFVSNMSEYRHTKYTVLPSIGRRKGLEEARIIAEDIIFDTNNSSLVNKLL